MWRKQDRTRHLICRLLPGFVITLAVAFCGTASLIGPTLPTPMLAWIGVYYWSLFRPASLPYWFLFLLGIMQDLVCGLPLGLSSLLLLLLRLFITRGRHLITLQHFIAIWTGFAIAAFVSGVLTFVLFSAIEDDWEQVNLTRILLSSLFTFILYPVFHLLFNKLYALLPALQPRAYTL